MKSIRSLFFLILTVSIVLSGCGGKEDAAEKTVEESAEETVEESAEEIVEEAAEESVASEETVYVPDSFTFSGGSGKMQIECPEVTIRDGVPYAKLHFSSTHLSYVKAEGTEYGLKGQDAEIPVRLNENMEITVLTTAMSQPHEVTYEIYIGVSALAGDTGVSGQMTLGDQYDRFDEAAPEIAGLMACNADGADESGAPPYASSGYLRLFRYRDADGAAYTLAEIDMTGGTALSGTDLLYAEDGTARAGLYGTPVVKYLLVPSDGNVPAGLDALAAVTAVPAQHIFEASGLEDLDLKTLIREKTDLIIIPGSLLPETEEDAEAYLEALEKLANHAEQLNMPFIVARQETDPEGQEAWDALYAIVKGPDA